MEQSARVCDVCMDQVADCVFLPCGHATSCLGCAHRLLDDRCPSCRQPLQEKKRLFR